MGSDIKIRTLRGAGIKTYIPSMVKVRADVFKEFPYLRVGGTEVDSYYLKKCSQSKDAIAVLVFDGPKVIGVSTGMPFDEQSLDLKKPFLEKGLDPAEFYYFGACALLKPYRGRGIAHHFFDLREEHVKSLKRFKKICLTQVVRPKTYARPKDYVSLDTFWKKRGYVEQQDLIGQLFWLEQGETAPTPQSIVFWIKEIA